ncbi:MAG: DUF4268 domain-containing protein [Candidatus Electryonea clarkiae]|nr:DUF4268 domain-containing protein [Candidatus Electryonea clarkiae]MDP8287189.1 DUF4268 domain-containing protein [Candidatus Electryonea clarkiae]
MALARLRKIDLREAWNNEASDFTNWLAEDENLQLLSDEIGIDISLIQTEASVGRFFVDILAEEENTGRKIVIENQLEATNHDHLGKLITYASGFDAEIVIWIVKDVKDEHKQAIDWLNEHTDDKIYLFAIKMELWQIAESPFAPKFQVISKPNDWAKTIKKTTAQSSLTDTKLLQLEFWDQFKEYAKEQKTSLNLRKAYPHHWYDISIGSSKAHIALIIDTRLSQLRCELYIPNSQDLYDKLFLNKTDIESKFDSFSLEWMELEGKKASRIRSVKDMENVTENSSWEEAFAWLLICANQYHSIFGNILRKTKF